MGSIWTEELGLIYDAELYVESVRAATKLCPAMRFVYHSRRQMIYSSSLTDK